MSQDQQTYTRASTASLIGLATQLLLTVLVAMLGFYTGSKAMLAGAMYLFPGLWIWVLIWVLYKQHRMERDEALEAAQLADSDARSAALFDEAGAQLAQAKRRLENIYKWAMPIVSLLTAIYLIGVGSLLLYLNNNALEEGSLAATPINEGINVSLVALLLVIAGLAGFLVARYVAGMTRVNEWQALRGGASTMIGHVFLGLLPLLITAVLLLLGNNAGFIYLAIALPIVMLLLGLEIVLGLVLGFYRPRKPGEFVRPAFDSRVLGWLTRPESMGKIFSETINYQFGFEVSKSWFMQLLSKALLPLSAVCIVVVIGMTTIVIVEPHQQAVVTQNGAFVRIAEPGISFKTPWPFGQAEKYDVHRVHSIRLGSRSHLDDEHKMDGPIFWTNPHVEDGAKEELLVTAPPVGAGEGSEQGSVLGEMIGADIDIKYRITDLRQYAGVEDSEYGSTDPETLLTTISQREVTRYFATHDAETLMSAGRANAGDELRDAIQNELNRYKTGLEVVFVSVSGVHPPQDVAEDYHKRINALQEQQTAVESAKQQADVILASAAGSPEQAQRLDEMISSYYALREAMRELDPQADAQRYAELEKQVDRQFAAIELTMIDSGGKVGQALAQARAARWSQSLDAQARALQLESQQQAFKNAPRYYLVSQYLDVLVASMADRPKTIIGPALGDDQPNVVLDLPLDAVPGLNLN